MTNPRNIQMIVLHGQTIAMPVGKRQKLQKTFYVRITGAIESRIKYMDCTLIMQYLIRIEIYCKLIVLFIYQVYSF